MTPVSIATEDELSEAVALKLLSEVNSPYTLQNTLRKGGFGYLKSRMSSWNQMAARGVVFVLTDLDAKKCPLELIKDWGGGQNLHKNLLLRIAVREVESWILADHQGMRNLIGAKGSFPSNPEELDDPKKKLLQLAKTAPKNVREELVRIGSNGNLYQGLGYNSCLVSWVKNQWNPEEAAKRSKSLAKARERLNCAISNF